MGELKDERRPDSLTPIALEAESIDQTVESMNRSGRWKLIAALAVLAVVVGGSGIWLRGIDQTGNYREAGKAVNSIKKTEFDRFWGCALPGVDLREMKSNADLLARIRDRSRASGVAYARQIRDRCLDILASAETRLDPNAFPADIGGFVIDMKGSVTKMREAWKEYVAYLTNPSTEFDEARASSFEGRIASGWYGFRKGHSELNSFLRSKLK
jgi:hypothetical protein